MSRPELILPRKYPECLERYLYAFQAFPRKFISSFIHESDTLYSIGIIRSLDSKERALLSILISTMKMYELAPLSKEAITDEAACNKLLEILFSQHPVFKNSGYVVIEEYNSHILLGYQYTFSFEKGVFKISELRSLPEIIPLGYDCIFTNAK